MPRANRYILPGFPCHLTHRCHNRAFLLSSETSHAEYRARLASQTKKHGLSLLDYCLTSNHVHLLAISDTKSQISGFMHDLQGGFASHLNRKECRSGALWDGRYHCTLVDGTDHLLNCLTYINLNMVRAGAVVHPRDWPWCGYAEIVGHPIQSPFLDLDRLTQLTGLGSLLALAEVHEAAIRHELEKGRPKRQARWTESIAIGDERFVREIRLQTRRPRRWVVERNEDGSWGLFARGGPARSSGSREKKQEASTENADQLAFSRG